MLMESGVNTGIMGCCCQKEDALFWKNRHIDAMKQLVQVRQENIELRKQLAGAKAQCENTVENRKRISELTQEVIDLREQLNIDMSVKKDLDEKLDKAAADYKALLVEHEEKIHNAAKSYARLATERNNLAETVSKMQSKIAKQAAEIKRLTEENERLSSKNDELSGRHEAQKANVACAMEMWHKYEKETETLKKALDIAAKDADANFERGQHKGQEELWGVLQDVSESASIGFDLEHVYGYNNMSDVVANLTASAFLRETEEYEKQAKDIQLGDEVEIFDEFDHDLSDIGIVIAMDKDNPCFAVIGPNFEGCFDETDIQSGNVRKTGQHFDSIPLTYLA